MHSHNHSNAAPFFRHSDAQQNHERQAWRARQALIRKYQEATGRSLVAFRGEISPRDMVPFVDIVDDLSKKKPLDLMLSSYGGDGHTSIRIARKCRGRKSKREFRIIVPDTAASAATLLTLAADSVIMGDVSVLGPIDPQIPMPTRDRYVAAKQITGIVNDFEERAKANPRATGLYGALLVDIDGITYQEAKAAIDQTEEIVSDMLKLRRDGSHSQELTSEIAKKLQSPATHAPNIGYAEAIEAKIPAKHADTLPAEYWAMLWELHTLYTVAYGPLFGSYVVIEGCNTSYYRPSARAGQNDSTDRPVDT